MSPFDSPQRTTETCHSISTSNTTSPSGGDGGGGGGGGGDVLLQWGQRKRSRVSRGAIEDSSSSVHTKQKKKISSLNNVPSKVVAVKCSSGSMPPPPPFVSSSAASNGSRSRKGSPRNLEDPSVAGSEPPSRNSQCSNSVVPKSAATKNSNSVMERSNKRTLSSASTKSLKPSGSSTTQASGRVNNSHGDSSSVQSEHEHVIVPSAPASTSLAANGDKVTVGVIRWPRIYIALSRKEKEDDFLAMKGTKIPQRPKKRAKNIDRTLQYCFPGMWLSDLTKSRYEVREKKSVKKQKHRGLKGLESLDSDSD